MTRSSLTDLIVLFSICVGMHLANQKLSLDIASILWAFNVEKSGSDPLSTDFVDHGAAAYASFTLLLLCDNSDFSLATQSRSDANLVPGLQKSFHWWSLPIWLSSQSNLIVHLRREATV